MNFAQRDGESLYEIWDNYKEIQRMCLYHRLEKQIIVHTFYIGLNYHTRLTINVVVGGALMKKSIEEALGPIEEWL